MFIIKVENNRNIYFSEVAKSFAELNLYPETFPTQESFEKLKFMISNFDKFLNKITEDVNV